MRLRRVLVLNATVLAMGSLYACGAGAPADGSDAADTGTTVRRTQVGPDQVAWYERGKGRTLVLLTGTGSTMAEWDPALLALLARHHRLLLYDYVGIGRSSALRTAHVSFRQMADQAAAFLRARHLGPVDVLGWSMGGFVAQQLAIRHPAVVRRLVLAGTNPGGEQTVLGSGSVQSVDSDPHASDAAVLRELYPITPRGQNEGRAFLRRLDVASERGTIPDDFTVPARTQRAQVAAEDPWLRSNVNDDALRRLKIPVLATGGRVDRVVPPVNLRRIARRVPHGTLRVFPGSHAFLFSDRVHFTAVVDRFLGGSRGRYASAAAASRR